MAMKMAAGMAVHMMSLHLYYYYRHSCFAANSPTEVFVWRLLQNDYRNRQVDNGCQLRQDDANIIQSVVEGSS